MADGNMDPREAAVAAGAEMYAFAERLYPICRSITGDGVRATLDLIGAHVPIERHEVATGTAVLDWTVPKEWNIRAASIRDMSGRVLVDLRNSSLHVVGYSMPVKARLTRAELEPHLHSLPATPDLIPYRTSYYKPEWGFCLSERQRQALGDGPFDITIDATLSDGALSYGEFLKRGESKDEVLLAAHICHPSLANDNCSGLAMLTHLARDLAKRPTRLSYRFLFAPGTIGAITWLARNRDKVDRIKHGLVISNVGDGGGPTYKRSRRGSAAIDRAAELVLG